VVARTRKTVTKKNATNKGAPSTPPPTIVTAAEAAGRVIGRAVATAVTTVEGFVGGADTQKKPAQTRSVRKAAKQKRSPGR